MKKYLIVGFAVMIALLFIVVSGCGGAGTTSKAPSVSTATSAVTSPASAAEIGPTQLVFTTQPGGAKAGQVFTIQPVVAVEDSNGNVVTNALARVNLLLNSTDNGELAGTIAVVAVNGIAKFTDLSIDKAGTGYTLKAVAVETTSVVSAPFDVSP